MGKEPAVGRGAPRYALTGNMLAALADSNFNAVRMAKVLGMSESTVRRRLRYGRVINLFCSQFLLLIQNTKEQLQSQLITFNQGGS